MKQAQELRARLARLGYSRTLRVHTVRSRKGGRVRATDRELEVLCINTIRTLAIDAVQRANSGHPGLPLGAAPMAYVLWQHHLRHNPANPLWPDRDRFVLSAGHGSMLLYALLYLTGYDVTLEDLRAFRQWGSITPGHPEFRLTPGVEATTGPLGQGAANAVGMAIAERMLAHRFNRPGFPIVDHRTYALLSDGDMMEGVCAEAASLAGHLRLGKLIFLYDSNGVSLDGPTSLAFSEDVAARFRAYGWRVFEVAHGNHDTAAIDQALTEAESDTSAPALIIVHTTLGYGSPNKAGTREAHGSPLGADEVRRTKEALGWDPNQEFFVPPQALQHFRQAVERGRRTQAHWDERFAEYAHAYPDLAEEWHRFWLGELPQGWGKDIPEFSTSEPQATRVAGGKVLNAIAKRVPFLVGGDADLSVSTNTALLGAGDFDGQTGAGRNLHFGVREHAMGAIANGLCYHGGLRPFVSTFLVFADYMRPPVRLAALSHLPVIYVWTHDSIGVGEDGPTHQPVEHLAALRAIPGLVVIRPCDANETAAAWRWVMQYREGPVAVILSRQKLPVLDRQRFAPAGLLERGAYVLSEATNGKPDAVILASGSEVHLALTAQAALEKERIYVRVVSMPSWELFARQDQNYREAVLPAKLNARVAVEAGVALGWERWVGERGRVLGLDRFGASAPGEVVLEKLGFHTANLVRLVKEVLAR